MSSEVTISAANPFAGTVLNVRDYRATGNGRTDDTPHLLAAIADSEEGDAIYFPPGTYLVSEPLVPKPRQLYFSLTDKATIKVRPVRAGQFSIFKVEAGPVEFRHLTLDLSKPPGRQPPNCRKDAPPALLAQAPEGGTIDLVVTSCRVRHADGQGIRVAGSGNELRHDRVVVRDTVIEDCCESGLALGRVNGARVEACRFQGCRNGVVAGSCRDVVISAVTSIDNRRHGIVLRFSYDWHVNDCLVMRNGGKERDQAKLRGWGIAAGGGPEERTPNSDFTITDNICEDNYAGGITLDPTFADDPETGGDESAVIWAQRARVSGNVCRGRRGGKRIGREDPFGTHGIHVRNSSDVVVTDNLCHDNYRAGIQVVNCSHVLVQANACYDNDNGIGLFSRTDLKDPAGPAGGLVIGVNMLYRNTQDDLKQGPFGTAQRAFPGLRLYGLHGSDRPECNRPANPGTLFEWHDEPDRQGALYVKERGFGTEGWVEVTTQPEQRCDDKPLPQPIKRT